MVMSFDAAEWLTDYEEKLIEMLCIRASFHWETQTFSNSPIQFQWYHHAVCVYVRVEQSLNLDNAANGHGIAHDGARELLFLSTSFKSMKCLKRE